MSNELQGLKYVLPEISEESKEIYVTNLVGKVFKILPIIEEQGKDLSKIYLWGLLNDVISANNLFNGMLIEVIVKLNSINNNNLTFKETRKVVFDCLDVIKKIQISIIKQ